MAINKASSFVHPITVSGLGTTNMQCEIRIESVNTGNKHTIYYKLNSNSYSTLSTKVTAGSYYINIPKAWFNNNNNILTVKVDTYDSSNKLLPGSFVHSIPLYNEKYTHNISTFLYPIQTYPGEICTIDILSPKNIPTEGIVYDVDINTNAGVSATVMTYVATNRGPGKFDFVIPDSATGPGIDVRVTTKNKATGQTIGSITQTIDIKQTEFASPQIIFPDNYMLTISEGVNTKFRGNSTDLRDYMVVYAKDACNVAEAVSKYDTSSGYYVASKSELRQRLLDNKENKPSIYVLKRFDEKSSFITQDDNDKHVFHIKTPATNDRKSFDDFYALQWMNGLEPGDLVYLHVIERRLDNMNSSVAPKTTVRGQVNITNWKCRHCQLSDYRWWSIYSNWSPYGKFALSDISLAISQYKQVSLVAHIFLDRSVPYPPTIYVSTSNYHNNMNAPTKELCLTPRTFGPSNTFEYTIPVSYISNHLANGKTSLYFLTHWGQNTSVSSAQFRSAHIRIITEDPIEDSYKSTYYKYSDAKWHNVADLSVSKMTPYVVLPPAVRPLKLTLKNQNEKQVTISYNNPLYGKEVEDIKEYSKIGSTVFDVSMGDAPGDLSNLNAVIENGTEVQVDNTLFLESNEKRLLTYEKKITLSKEFIDKLKKTPANDLYMDLDIKSIDNKNLNFRNITSNDIKLQIMFSKSGGKKYRVVDFNTNIIDLKQSNYKLQKILLNKTQLVNYDLDTIHLLYNIDQYDNGKAFKVENKRLFISNDAYLDKIGLKKVNNKFVGTSFTTETFKIASHALNFDMYEIRLRLENLSADKDLYEAPEIVVKHKKWPEGTDTETILCPTKNGKVKRGEDVLYKIPRELYNVNYDDVLTFSMRPVNPYPMDLGDVLFSDAYIEVIEIKTFDQVVDKYSNGFIASIDFLEEWKTTSTATTVSTFDPVIAVDIIMCCYDKNKKLLNYSPTKCRDIHHGKKWIYYSDRKWHSFVNEKYKNHIKYKKEYEIPFNIPNNTEYVYFIAFTYGNWHDNPSIYSMSNILTAGSVKQDMNIEFIEPLIQTDVVTGEPFINTDINNPVVGLRLNSQKSGAITLEPGYDTVTGVSDNNAFTMSNWLQKPIVYSNTKDYGYEMPNFKVNDLYYQNNVVDGFEPLYNDIERYGQWKDIYGKEPFAISSGTTSNDPVDILSDYTIYEDEGDKFISNRSVPYIEIPADLIKYDRSKITLFLDADFGVGMAVGNTKLVTETFTEDFKISKIRGNTWGVKTLWTRNLMDKFMDIAEIEDIKIEWGMKLNRNHTHPTEGRRGPILVEDLWVNSSSSYDYNPATTFPDECSGKAIRDYGGHDIWHKNYNKNKGEGDYIYFEITNPRIKRLFLECNCHRRRHDAIIFEDYQYDWCWDTTVKVKFTVTRKVRDDGTPLYKRQNLPAEHFGEKTWVAGWAMYSMPKFKIDNVGFIKSPSNSDPSFIMTYDVLLSPVVYYYKNNPITGDGLGNIYKYAWGDNADAYMKWETITVKGTAPYVHQQTHYYIAYERPNVVYTTIRLDVSKDGAITPK